MPQSFDGRRNHGANRTPRVNERGWELPLTRVRNRDASLIAQGCPDRQAGLIDLPATNPEECHS